MGLTMLVLLASEYYSEKLFRFYIGQEIIFINF